MDILIGLIFVWGLLCWAVGYAAESRGRSFIAFFILSLVTSPVLGLIVLLIMKDIKAEEQRDKARLDALAERDLARREEHEKQIEALRAITVAVAPKATAFSDAASATSIADELTKLARLVEVGLLTPEEFSAQKAALLNGSLHKDRPRDLTGAS
ncbi:hypothetical protein JI742_09030 [Piscinibacter sp. Jin2]|uniref:SHOCT domain-containing protein n=1 Tax=Aquariibacter lacus TaxID=2801332 RepID=A0A9X0XHE0_9BURK|nr:SHOCT domain-containing protein [Piscinibacter lacus]MBL0720028.1 hypothetical protein [Piscinibacter lacus]